MRPLLVLVCALAAVGAAAAGTPGFGAAVVAPDGLVRYIVAPAAASTTVRAVRVRDGKVVRSATVPGSFRFARVAYTGAPEGVSGDGSTLVLAAPPHVTTSFAVLSTRTLRQVRLFSLHGDFTYDAVSPDGRMVYLIEYLAEPTYQVRAFDVAKGRLLGRVIADKSDAGEPMQGYPLTRASPSGGAWAYTLYGRDGAKAFVHALYTAHAIAVCVDLPWRITHASGATMSLEGSRLVLRRHGVRLGAVDTATFRVVK
jgi:hypothetical protein